MYQQTLVKTLENHIKPNLLEKNNRYKKWSRGYNADIDAVIISNDGTIGEVIEIQNLKIALPQKPKKIYKSSEDKKEQKWSRLEYPKELERIKSVFDWDRCTNEFKERNGTTILILSSKEEMKGFGFTITEIQRM